ncbi:hydrolase 76 protein [Tulasnella sp. JGI-2019a]|nr:hydrolase 76 protein [Tulasnella sp. JGI-2019a]
MRLLVLLTSASLLLYLSAASPIEKRAQCASQLSLAATIADRLVSYWYNPTLGYFNSGSLWTDANTYEDMNNLMLAAGTNTYYTLDENSQTGKDGQAASASTWASTINGSNDDSLWLVLTMWKIADYLTTRGKDATGYLNSATEIYNMIAAEWDTTNCGGGVWWSTAHTYKNAITNELFLLTSASGYLRTGEASYLANAQKEWTWLNQTGMRNSQGLYNDGLDLITCANNGQTTWTYNQGVIASGLAALSVATGDKSLLDIAEVTLDAAFSNLTQGGILKESCDDAAAGGSQCNHDQQLFKGLLMKHLQYYLDMANDPVRTAKYAPIIDAQASAVLHYGKNAANDIGSVWYAPDSGGSVWQPEASASGLAVIVAAAKYGTCL